MARLHVASLLFPSVLLWTTFVTGQTASPDSPGTTAAPSSIQLSNQVPSKPQASNLSLPPQQPSAPAPPIPADAPRMSRETRLEIIRDFETQLVYARSIFPMGAKGIKLKDGVTSPNGPELQQALALDGPAIRPGDPAHISFVQIKNDHIHFDLNGGPIHRKKWFEHVQVSGANGTPVPLGPNEAPPNPHGSYLDVYFDKYVPEMTAHQLRDLLFPVLDFNAKSKEEAYLDTVPPKVKEAILEHRVLVGMNTEMVLYAKGKAPKKVRERDGETEYEEWIYGEAPQDVDFVRIVGDEVVRIETMKVGGQKIVRTEKEVILEHKDKDTEAKKQEQDRPSNAPSLRRPGEDQENAPQPSDTVSPVPPAVPTTIPQGPPNDHGPDEVVNGHL